jgi:hypothetical protein
MKTLEILVKKLGILGVWSKMNLLRCFFAIRRDRIMNKLYVDLVVTIVAIFNHQPTTKLLSICTIREFILQNIDFLIITIYIDNEYLVYHYGFICPVLPMQPEALGYILRLPRIMKSALALLFLITTIGIYITIK